MQIDSKIYADIPVERRLLGRVPTGFRARAGRGRELAQSVTVQDISAGGVRIDGWRGLATGMELAIELPPFSRLAARVMWVVGRDAGCEFGSRLSEEELARIIAANTPEAPAPERPVFGRKGV